ncbi:hypothetical protein OA005_00625 [Paracoccaceae bacterium]|nr:hypothetical protein [Paracoccaceae bacterium]
MKKNFKNFKKFFLVVLLFLFNSSFVLADLRKPSQEVLGKNFKENLSPNEFIQLRKQKKVIEETFLDKINVNGLGLISVENSQLPNNLWINSNEKLLVEKLKKMPPLQLASTNKIFKRLLIVNAKPPLNSIGTENMGFLFLLSRVDKLIELGAIDEAEEILTYIKKPSIEIMKRKIEISLINGRIKETCNQASSFANFDGLLQFKIICLLRQNDWQAAVLVFTAGVTLNHFDDTEKNLLLNFLEPDLEMDITKIGDLNKLSPISFFLLLGNNKLEFATQPFKNKFSYALIRSDVPIEIKIAAAEKLVLNYTLSPNFLFNIYRTVSAKTNPRTKNLGRTLLKLDMHLNLTNDSDKLTILSEATKEFYQKNLLAQFVSEYHKAITWFANSDQEKLTDLAIILLSLTDIEHNMSRFYKSSFKHPEITCLMDIKSKNFVKRRTDDDFCNFVKTINIETIKSTFHNDKNFNARTEKGLILLECLNLLSEGIYTDQSDIELSLRLLAKIGLIELANEIAAELLALNATKKIVEQGQL